MRVLAYAAPLSVVLALAGCGDSGSTAEWSVPPDPRDTPAAVASFKAYAADVEERWEGSAAMTAAEFLRLDERTAARTTIEGSASAEGTGPETVVVTLEGLLDDSVRAERWTLELAPQDDRFELTSARWEQRCQPGRGHEDFSTEPCI